MALAQQPPSPATLLAGLAVCESVAADTPRLVHLAVAFAGRLLSDLGADVARVVPVPDPLATLRVTEHERLGPEGGVTASYLGAGKTTRAASIEAGALLLTADPSAAAAACEAGGPAVLATACAVDAGAAAPAAVSELGVQGLVGLTDLFGEPDASPLMMGGHQTAYAFGFAIFAAAVAARAKALLQGSVDVVEVNAVDALAWVNWKGVAAGALDFPIARAGRAAEAPVLRCADGWFALLHMPNNWEDLKAEVADARLDDERFVSPGRRARNALALNEIFADWAQERTRDELYAFCQRCAIPGGPVLDGEDLLTDSLYQHREFLRRVPHRVDDARVDLTVPGLPLTVEGWQADASAPAESAAFPPPDAAIGRPLAGLTVLDLGIFTAGSVTSTLLGDLGARVIKVESESYSDPFRKWPGIKGDSPLFTFNNRNKLGVNIDLKSDAGHAAFLELVAQADVVVENFRRGVLERLGIGYDVLRGANPRIVLASISGQGASGPGSQHVSFGSTLEAIAGISALTGYPGGACYISGRNLNYPDQIVCLYGLGATIGAILQARARGAGMHIDVSQREVATLAVGETLAAASIGDVRPDFVGNASVNALLQDILPAADGWLCVTVADASQQRALAERLACQPDRDALSAALATWVETQPVLETAQELQRLGIAAFKANSGGETAQEPLIASGGAFARTPAGAMVKGFPFQFRAAPLTVYEESPTMGQHTDGVLAGLRSNTQAVDP
ncbi:MAG: CoA transferase [Pseudomonadota bacterium]